MALKTIQKINDAVITRNLSAKWLIWFDTILSFIWVGLHYDWKRVYKLVLRYKEMMHSLSSELLFALLQIYHQLHVWNDWRGETWQWSFCDWHLWLEHHNILVDSVSSLLGRHWIAYFQASKSHPGGGAWSCGVVFRPCITIGNDESELAAGTVREADGHTEAWRWRRLRCWGL